MKKLTTTMMQETLNKEKTPNLLIIVRKLRYLIKNPILKTYL
jgi:hypothetical protein